MDNKKIKNALVNFLIFGIGFFLMLGRQIHWLKKHQADHIVLRLIFCANFVWSNSPIYQNFYSRAKKDISNYREFYYI